MTTRSLPPDWFRTDAIIAISFSVVGAFMAWVTIHSQLFTNYPTSMAVLVGSVLMALPLAWRRRYPLTVALLVNGIYILFGTTVGIELYVSQVMLFLAVYSAGAWSGNRRRAFWTRLLICIAMAIWLCYGILRGDSLGSLIETLSLTLVLYRLILVTAINFSFFVGAWVFGNRAWSQAMAREQLEQAYRDIRALKDELVEHAVSEERIRIARELHDVVAHHVTTMSVQAAAARRLLQRDPDRATESLKQVEASARLAVSDLRTMVLTLREGDQERESLPTLAQLDDLLASSQQAGVQVELERIGELPPLSPAQELTLYRVAQEALTNVAKHAGPLARAIVRLRARSQSVELEISDTGTGSDRSLPGTGTGLIGMKERVAALGGTLEAGPKPRGGFLVRAEIPTGERP